MGSDRATAMIAELVCLGAFAGTHGVQGAVRIKPFTAEPENVAAYGPVSTQDGDRVFNLSVTGVHRGLVICTAPEITSREQAQALKGEKIYVPRSVLPKPGAGEYYHQDLVGLEVRTADGRQIGKITAVHNFGAGDVLEIENNAGDTSDYLAFSTDNVPQVDLGKGFVVLAATAILFAEEEPE